jgi:hypothetical protein
MDRFYIAVGKYAFDIVAWLAFAVVVGWGSYLAWNYDPAWLNRAGALVVIIGILLAASRFYDRLQDSADAVFSEGNIRLGAESIASIEAERGNPLTEEDVASVVAKLRDRVRDHVKGVLKPGRRRLKLWELYFVLGGEFLSGFGDLIVSVLKSRMS